MVNRQILIGNQRRFVNRPDCADTAAGLTSPLTVKSQFFGSGSIKTHAADRTNKLFLRRNRQSRLQIMPVRATVTGQPGIHKPQTVQQLRTCPECTPNSGNARSLMKGQCRRNMQNFINQSFRSLRHTPSGIS